jgi:hypothetical protein
MTDDKHVSADIMAAALKASNPDPLSRWQKGFNSGVEAAASALEVDAKLCDCAAREERECGCGAWCEWKSITSARAIEIVRELKNIPPPEGDGY